MQRFSKRRCASSTRRQASRTESLERRQLLASFYPCLLPDATEGNTLRAAVIAANKNGEDNTIYLKAGKYELTLCNDEGQENCAKTGDLDITSAGHTLVIKGQGSDNTFIDANCIDRIFQVFPGAKLVLRKLTLTDGLARDDGYPFEIPMPGSVTTEGVQIGTGIARGGAILNYGGCVRLCNTVVRSSTALGFNPLEIIRTTSTQNGSAPDGFCFGAAQGGGIWTDAPISMANSTIWNNKAIGADGLGNYLPSGSAPASTPVDGFINLNDGGDAAGGGIYSTSCVDLWKSTITLNCAVGGDGGDGLFLDNVNAPAAAPEGPTIIILGAAGDGGEAKGGGIYCATLTAGRSTIKNNNAVGGDGGDAGAEIVRTAQVDGEDNNLDEAGYGGDAFGGGVYVCESATICQTTISCNTAVGGDGGIAYGDEITPDLAAPLVDGQIGYGGDGGWALGGGIYFKGCKLEIKDDSAITNNSAIGGLGNYGVTASTSGIGGSAAGGGVACQSFAAQVSICDTNVSSNHAVGGCSAFGGLILELQQIDGFGGADAYGGGIAMNPFIFRFIPTSTTTDGMDGPHQASLLLDHATVSFNCAKGGEGLDGRNAEGARDGGNGGSAYGGGVYVFGGCVTVAATVAAHDTAEGGDGGDGRPLKDDEVEMAAPDSELAPQPGPPYGGKGGNGGDAFGGGMALQAAKLAMNDSALWCDQAIGGDGGTGGHLRTGGNGGDAGYAFGGGLSVEGFLDSIGTASTSSTSVQQLTACLTRVDVYANKAVGGDGGDGGDGGPFGGNAGYAGDAFGGGIFDYGELLKLIDSKVSKNRAIGGDGGNGGWGSIAKGEATNGGDAFGGGIRVDSADDLIIECKTSVYFNCVVGGEGGTGKNTTKDGLEVGPDISTAPLF